MVPLKSNEMLFYQHLFKKMFKSAESKTEKYAILEKIKKNSDLKVNEQLIDEILEINPQWIGFLTSNNFIDFILTNPEHLFKFIGIIRHDRRRNCILLKNAIKKGFHNVAIHLFERYNYNVNGKKIIELALEADEEKVVDYLIEHNANINNDMFERIVLKYPHMLEKLLINRDESMQIYNSYPNLHDFIEKHKEFAHYIVFQSESDKISDGMKMCAENIIENHEDFVDELHNQII